MMINRSKVRLRIIFGFLLLAIFLYSQYTDYTLSKIPMNGIVKYKKEECGRSCTYYLFVDWENIGMKKIATDSWTFSRLEVGGYHSVKNSYFFPLGLVGVHYAPDPRKYPVMGFLSFFYFIASVCLLSHGFYKLRRNKKVSNDE